MCSKLRNSDGYEAWTWLVVARRAHGLRRRCHLVGFALQTGLDPFEYHFTIVDNEYSSSDAHAFLAASPALRGAVFVPDIGVSRSSVPWSEVEAIRIQ